MKLVLDNNVLFSIMNPFSAAAYLFFSIKADFIAPEFIKQELVEHIEECLIKSKLSDEQFEMMQIEIEESIKFFKSSEYKEFLDKSLESISDPDDIDFLALALSTNSSIWSNDSHLKEQTLVPAFTTKDLLEMFLRGEI
jgi:predicted nucleic acid-binding protein